MKNFDGNCRMIQGMYKNKLLTINMETLLTSDKEKEELKEFMISEMLRYENNNLSVNKLKSGEYLCPNESFIRKLYIQWGNESMLIDMINMILIENNSNFNVKQGEAHECFTNLKQMEHYNNSESIHNVKISLDEINIIVSNYSNPQVRSIFLY